MLSSQSKYTVQKIREMRDLAGTFWSNPCEGCGSKMDKSHPLYMVTWFDEARVIQYAWMCFKEECVNLYILGNL